MEDGSGTSAAGAAAARGRIDVAGVTRGYRYNELIGAQGGLTALHFAARQGSAAAARALVDGGVDVNSPSPGDQATPLLVALINGHFDLAAYLLEKGAESQPAERGRRVAALCGAQRAVGADRRVSAAARAPAAVARLSRHDEAAARQGRRSERAGPAQGLVLGLQLRSVGRGRSRRDAVLARRLCRGRRGDEAAGVARRRSVAADDEAVFAARSRGPGCRRRQVRPAAGRRSAARARRRCMRRRAPAMRRASPATRITSRRRACCRR